MDRMLEAMKTTPNERSYHKCVVTGGPAAGKTTFLSFAPQRLVELGCEVFTMPEIPTDLILRGMDLATAFAEQDWKRFYAYEDAIITAQFFNELLMHEMLERLPRPTRPRVLLLDRGMADPFAYYHHEDEKMRIMTKLRLQPQDIYNYDLILHLVTAADGAEEYYSNENNKARYETPEQARETDKKTQRLWLKAAHYGTKFEVIDNSTDLEEKMRRAILAICQMIGIPEPTEKERWYLVKNEVPVDNIPADNTELEIEQVYLISDEDGTERRIRRLTHGGIIRCYLTEKRPTLKPDERVEVTEPISESLYYELQDSRDPEHEIISKKRICFLHKNQFFEMDVFQHPHPGLIKLEIETTADEQIVTLPDWIDAIEVTGNKKFSNHSISKKGAPRPSA